ncbi:Replication termination factor 2 [Didymosphaeria variabile]|uniref:Replication termination factor 2 n=1 Tax=Didymosphaeria variabile TaxID=1932322 RepID=A0A9W8XG83_9PLEO|nr:Replication termination factor 2 [Didymosphaeria variabile]KAJ4349965.1 Replication termination factor 2 [Didymosphaeria variabile]
MGNDGGSIPKRRELVKEAAKAPTASQIKEARAESQEHAWNHCPLSSKPLSAPVVSDCLGTLYNKDSILEFLLAEDGNVEKVEGEKVLGGRVKGLKDVVEVKFEVDGEEDKGAGRKEKWVCPVTKERMGPQAKAVYVVPCGHAFAGSVCNEAYAENDVIPILPTAPADIARLNIRIKTLKEKNLTHALKKAPGSKKRKKNAEVTNGEALSGDAKAGTLEEDKKVETSSEKKKRNSDNGIKNASTAYLTKKVLEEQEERNKRRKLDQNDNVKSLFSKGNQKADLANSKDYMTRGFSIGGK